MTHGCSLLRPPTHKPRYKQGAHPATCPLEPPLMSEESKWVFMSSNVWNELSFLFVLICVPCHWDGFSPLLKLIFQNLKFISTKWACLQDAARLVEQWKNVLFSPNSFLYYLPLQQRITVVEEKSKWKKNWKTKEPKIKKLVPLVHTMTVKTSETPVYIDSSSSYSRK